MVDLDVVLAYKTIKMVKMQDRKLGIISHSVRVIVLLYIAVFVFYVNKAYLTSELAVGQVKIMLRGGGLMTQPDRPKGVPLDAHDLRAPSIENGALFVVTKIQGVQQTRGVCQNADFKCSSDSDCPLFAAVSTQECMDGYCKMAGWCPPVGLTDDTKEYVLSYEHSNISAWFRTAIQFPNIHPGVVFTNMDRSEPVTEPDEGQTDTWPLEELLAAAGVNFKDVIDTGAMINARLQWDCQIDTGEGCKFPVIQAKRLDSGSGYQYSLPKYLRSPDMDFNKDIRLLYRMSGIRVLVVSKGEGKKFDWPTVILQLSSALALLGMAFIVTDAVMLNVLPEKRHYRQYKEFETPDFSDIRDKLVELKGGASAT